MYHHSVYLPSRGLQQELASTNQLIVITDFSFLYIILYSLPCGPLCAGWDFQLLKIVQFQLFWRQQPPSTNEVAFTQNIIYL